MRLASVLPLLTALLLPVAGESAVTFQFTYDSAAGGDLWTDEAKAALNVAAETLGGYFSAYDAVIHMQVSGSNENTLVLASAGAGYMNLSSGFGNLGMVGDKILSNGAIDPNGPGYDGSVNANFFRPWSFTDTVGAGQFDFISTMIHELGHALGFSSGLDSSGASMLGTGMYSPFDQFIINGAGERMISESLTLSPSWAVDSIGGTGTAPATPGSGLYFNGAFAMAANGGNPVPLYTPNPWEDGSSGAHLDDEYFTGASQQLMNAASTTGPGVRTLSDIEIGIFKDLGYLNITSAPEPVRSSFLLLGLAALCLRRGRRM